jgi:regulator of sirC expression with transglutaminase-like and TPR domain
VETRSGTRVPTAPTYRSPDPHRERVAAPAPSARQLFVRETRRPDRELDLGRAALLVAREEYPQLPVELYLARLDQMAEDVRDRLAHETAPPVVLQELLDTLYRRHRLKGNRDAYYDPRNSFLNDVLDRHLGIPLTLGIIMLEVGWRVGLPLEGVNFPHHFLVRLRGDAVDLLIDPFDGGEIRFEDQAQEFLDRVYGGMVRVRPSFLRAASRRDMLSRLLMNLKGLYLNVNDDRRAAAALERLLLLRPDAAAERRMLGLVLSRLGRPGEAAEHLREFLEADPGSPEAPRVRAFLDGLERGEALDA